MTATIDTPTAADAPAPAEVVRELVDVDPRELLLDRNIRDAQLDKAFVASIKAHGVLVAITAVRTAEGAIRVRYGHRRTLGAIEADRPTVPVWIVGAEDDDATARILAQWAENEHRAGLTDRERVGAVDQLAAFGLSAGQIARRLHAPRKTIDQALAAAGSEIARAAVARYDFLTIEQAATVAQFEDDLDAIPALVAAAKLGPVEFARAEARAREDAQDRAERAAALDGITAPVIDRPGWNDQAKRVAAFVDAQGEALTPESHEQCPGRVVWLDREWSYPDDDSDEDARLVYTVVHGCADPERHGHQRLQSTSRPAGAAPVDDEKEREAKRAERRKVIEGNKAWRAAEPIRRDWLRSLLARKTAPKGTAAFITAAIVNGEGSLSDGRDLAAKLLGLPSPTNIATAAATATDSRAQVLTLALTVAGYEATMDVQTWRQSEWGQKRVRAYFAFIEANGYPLDAIERTASGIKAKKAKSVEQNEVAA